MTDGELLRLARDDGPTAIFVKQGGKTNVYKLAKCRLFGRRFLLVKTGHGLPVKLIACTENGVFRKLSPEECPAFAGIIPAKSCGAVYPLSVAKRLQNGDIFNYGGNVLFWHKCGFAFLYGAPDKAFLDEVYKCFISPESVTERRFVLFADDETWAYFADKPGIAVGRRYFFEYQGDTAPETTLPAGYELHEINAENFGGCAGRITPLFSWDSREDFLRGGKGFCVTCGGRPAAWAFSAAVSRAEIDIGVETAEEHRRKGLAAAAAAEMIRFSLGEGKHPVWACSAENIGSRRLAEKLGFVKTGECFTVTKSG